MAETAEQPAPMTVSEFLAFEGEPDTRYELVDGGPFAMAPAASFHGTLAVNIAVEIDRRLDRRPGCRAQSEAGISIDDQNFFVADVAASCAPPENTPYVAEPFLIVEILSPSTDQHDLGRKLQHYKDLDSVEEIWLVDSRRRWTEVWQRDETGWHARDYIGRADFPSFVLDDQISLDRLYRNTTL